MVGMVIVTFPVLLDGRGGAFANFVLAGLKEILSGLIILRSSSYRRPVTRFIIRKWS